jgi:hypothetical protein
MEVIIHYNIAGGKSMEKVHVKGSGPSWPVRRKKQDTRSRTRRTA